MSSVEMTLEKPGKTLQVQPVTPMTLIEQANAQGDVSVERMGQLFDLQLRWEQNEARKAFDTAMSQFKSNPPRINKNVQKKAGPIDLHYASLDNVVDSITPALSAVGIRHRWETRQEGETIFVTCILSHNLGHSESTTLSAPYDKSGGKNPIQAVASANTYLQRYTLLAATGLAASGMDDDGTASGKPNTPQMNQSELLDYMCSFDECTTKDELIAKFQEAYRIADNVGDKMAMQALRNAKDKRKAVLS